MNNSISDKEWRRRDKEFPEKYIDWIKNHKKNEPIPIYPPELNNSENGYDYWEYQKGEELLLGDMGENKENRSSDLIKRMIKSYNKNKTKIANKIEQPELSQSDKRKRKLSDLNSRSLSWKGLEHFTNNTSTKP